MAPTGNHSADPDRDPRVWAPAVTRYCICRPTAPGYTVPESPAGAFRPARCERCRMSEGASVAELLERSAVRVESSPGLNVLDAIREETVDLPRAERDAILVDTFYSLLDYLPPHVDSLERWSDSETSDRVAGKLRQLARTIRNGGPVHVDAISTPPAPDELDLLERAGGRNRGVTHRRRFVRSGEQESGSGTDDSRAAGNAGSALPAAVTPDDYRAVALIAESRAFPAERVPVRVS